MSLISINESLDSIGRRHQTDKSTITHCYLDNYEKYFSSWKDREFNLLEIGVAAGNSLRMWREYFSRASVYGIDNNPDCSMEGVTIGDQSDERFLQEAMDHIPEGLDIIIDDGSHVGHDMIKTFKYLFPKMNPGGLYIIEDTHCFYSDHYEQGSGVFNFFTGLARDVDVAGRAMTGNTDYAINHGMTDPPVPKFSRILKAIHIHPSLWILERR